VLMLAVWPVFVSLLLGTLGWRRVCGWR